MNSVIVQSRFACLQIEDEEPKQSTNKRKPNAKTVNGNKKSVTTTASSKKTQLKQQLAKEQPIKKKKSKPMSEQQWEEWKKRDSELVNDCFQQDMQKAILQSKLDYEAQKISSSQQNEAKKENNKKKKNKTMSLDQFLSNPENKDKQENKDPETLVTQNENFFEKIIHDAKVELNREEALERQKKRNENIEEVISLAHFQERLEKEKAKNTALQEELKLLKKEMESVKARNKTLCSMLSQGEMKDKADVLLELDRLNTVKDELTQEVARLHGLLEQERSKTAALSTDSKHRIDKKSKKH